MGTALVIGITVTLRLTVFGVEAFVLGKPPPTGPAEKVGSVSHLRTITRKRRYEQADGTGRLKCLFTDKENEMKSVQKNKHTMQQRNPMQWLCSCKTATAVVVLIASVGMAAPAFAVVLSDYTVIQNDTSILIGDGNPVWNKTFNTGGRQTSEAFLTLNVAGLTFAVSGVEVRINHIIVGHIHPYAGLVETAENWYSQTIVFPGSVLHDGNNEIEIRAVSFPGATPGNIFDDFFLKSVICHFHQAD
jgi:hypothetical protein